MRMFERFLILRVIDDEWKDHLYEMDMMKEGIHLRAYGQKDPLIEYKREAFVMFESLIDRINEKTINILWKFQVQEDPESIAVNDIHNKCVQFMKVQLILALPLQKNQIYKMPHASDRRNINRSEWNKKLAEMIPVLVGAVKNIKSVVEL